MTCYCYACKFLKKEGDGDYRCLLRSKKETIPILLRGICGCLGGRLKEGAPENDDYIFAETALAGKERLS